MMKELRSRTRLEINDFPIPESQGEWQAILNKMVSTYLIHHGYCNTAEAFAHITEQPFNEDIGSIKNRQKILKLVLAGRMGEAIEKTSRLYPGLLENNQKSTFLCSSAVSLWRCNKGKQTVEEMNQQNVALNGSNCTNETSIINTEDSDVDMDTSEEVQNGHGDMCMNGKNNSTNGYQNGTSHGDNNTINVPQALTICCDNEDEDMEVEVDVPCRKPCSKPVVERILEFGKELYSMSQRLNVDKSSSDLNQKMLEDAFSLLAYSNPWASPVGWQLEPSQRESVCASLNSAILESNNKPRKPPLEVAMAHAQEVVRLMSSAGLGSCAFASLVDILDQ
ncbi:hypothetical protein NQ314_020555 [Rhamnusium bicolor]|uniref:CTLH domain-containing protein n=1 Tax=Rhamnusium bicolor TaxID=1586634 RepID=A0AAV8WJR9_9CUCU|nr:hypothetical protein NQ314_020555 [Rhamnusium bicolor]